MKIRIAREKDVIEVSVLIVEINNTRYRISQSIDNKLNINKTTNDDDGLLYVNPRTSNEIELM